MSITNRDIKQWQGLVFNIVNRYRKNTPAYKSQIDWDEVTQVGLIALYKCLENYNPDKGNFKNYAITAIKNAILRQYFRFDKLCETHTDIEDYNGSYNFDDSEIDISITKEKIKKIISTLSIEDKSKRVLLLRLEGKSLVEIAKELGVTYQAVSCVIHNHKNKIKERLYNDNRR